MVDGVCDFPFFFSYIPPSHQVVVYSEILPMWVLSCICSCNLLFVVFVDGSLFVINLHVKTYVSEEVELPQNM